MFNSFAVAQAGGYSKHAMRALERPDPVLASATQRWIEAAVDERVRKVIASTQSLSDWVATTCQQGAEASRITAAALHESEEARRHLQADVRRLAEQQERFFERSHNVDVREVQKLKEMYSEQQERFSALELRLRSKEVSDTSRDEEFSSMVRDVQSLQLAMQRLESQWEKANVKFNKVGLEVASTTSAASIWEGQCRSAQAHLESRLEALSKSLSDMEVVRNEGLERFDLENQARNQILAKQESDAKAKLEKESFERIFAAVEKRCNDLAEQIVEISKSQADLQELTTSAQPRDEYAENRRSVENLQRRMQSMQVALETIAELRQEDHALCEELKLEHQRFRQKLGYKVNNLELGLGESLKLVEKMEDMEVFAQNLQEDMLQYMKEVKRLTKDAAREVKDEIQGDFRSWVKSWDRGFQHEMPNIERELKQQLSGYLKER